MGVTMTGTGRDGGAWGALARTARLVVDQVRVGLRAEHVWLTYPGADGVGLAGTLPGPPPGPLDALAHSRRDEPRILSAAVPLGFGPPGRLVVLLDASESDCRPALDAFATLAAAALDLAAAQDGTGNC